MQWLHV